VLGIGFADALRSVVGEGLSQPFPRGSDDVLGIGFADALRSVVGEGLSQPFPRGSDDVLGIGFADALRSPSAAGPPSNVAPSARQARLARA
jgi:hypothetical protein